MAKRNPMQAVRKKPQKKVSSGKGKTKGKNRYAPWIIGAVLLLSAFFSWFLFFAPVKAPSVHNFRKMIPKGYPTVGIDVSHHQGKMDWESLFNQSGYDSIIHFVYCKATEGSDHLDTQWEQNRKSLNELGIPNGAYHFFISKAFPRPQAAHFLKHWQKRDIDLPPVLDVEQEGFSDPDLIAKMKIWLDTVERATGMRPIIYCPLNFYETKFRNEFQDYKFWIAAYSRQPVCLKDDRVIHWQFSETGRIPGCREMVDLNVSKLKF